MNDQERYAAAAHGMQSGVAMEMNHDPTPTTPKHLRVGVNCAMVEHAALVELLVAKGLFTQSEYLKAIADAMERERDLYQERLSKRMGTTITLH